MEEVGKGWGKKEEVGKGGAGGRKWGRGGAEYAVLLLCAVYHNPLPTLLNNLQ